MVLLQKLQLAPNVKKTDSFVLFQFLEPPLSLSPLEGNLIKMSLIPSSSITCRQGLGTPFLRNPERQ